MHTWWLNRAFPNRSFVFGSLTLHCIQKYISKCWASWFWNSCFLLLSNQTTVFWVVFKKSLPVDTQTHLLWWKSKVPQDLLVLGPGLQFTPQVFFNQIKFVFLVLSCQLLYSGLLCLYFWWSTNDCNILLYIIKVTVCKSCQLIFFPWSFIFIKKRHL